MNIYNRLSFQNVFYVHVMFEFYNVFVFFKINYLYMYRETLPSIYEHEERVIDHLGGKPPIYPKNFGIITLI